MLKDDRIVEIREFWIKIEEEWPSNKLRNVDLSPRAIDDIRNLLEALEGAEEDHTKAYDEYNLWISKSIFEVFKHIIERNKGEGPMPYLERVRKRIEALEECVRQNCRARSSCKLSPCPHPKCIPKSPDHKAETEEKVKIVPGMYLEAKDDISWTKYGKIINKGDILRVHDYSKSNVDEGVRLRSSKGTLFYFSFDSLKTHFHVINEPEEEKNEGGE